jgi:hypothetical protein
MSMNPEGVDWKGQSWGDLVPRLLLVASARLYRMTWRGERRGTAPGATEAADFVNDAISKTIAGVRAWKPQACTLFQHLAGVILSDISHAAGSIENRSTLRDSADRSSGPDAATGGPGSSASHEAELLWQHEQRNLLSYLDRVDPALRQMAELMLLHDMTATEDLSRSLCIVPAEVANRRKRLKRAVRAYLAEADS